MSVRVTPPGPRPRLFGAGLREYQRDRLGFLARCAREHGDMVFLRLRWQNIFLLNHPDLIEEVLVKKNRNFKKGIALTASSILLGNGLLTSYGDIWLRQRRLAQPAFHKDRLPGYFDTTRACIESLLASWQPGETRQVYKEMKRISLECLTRCLFCADLHDDFAEFMAGMEGVMDGFLRWSERPLLAPFLIASARRRRALVHLNEIVYRLIAARRSEGSDRGDLMSALLAARSDETGAPLSDSEARDATMTLLMAGVETSALSAFWTWYLLSRHPWAEARVVSEVAAALQGRPPEFADLPRLPYTETVLMESLRLYPPVYQFGRQALADCDIGGYRVPARSYIWISPWVMHRDPRYFDRPDEFDPARWDDDLRTRLPAFAYFPFSGGPRVCIGNSLAMMQGMLLTALIAQKFCFSPMRAGEVREAPGLVLNPGPGAETVLAPRPDALCTPDRKENVS